jgi:hypothetical protein
MRRRVGIVTAGMAIGFAIGVGGVWTVWRVTRALDISIWFGVAAVGLLIAMLEIRRHVRGKHVGGRT